MTVLIKDRRIAENAPPPDLVVEPADDLALVAAALGTARVVAVRFPKFGDGRGFSTARLLRERYGYRGELRAVGEVARDHLYAMAQCGFDAFELRAGEDPQEALAAFGDFTTLYPATAAEPLPLFRRRSGPPGDAAIIRAWQAAQSSFSPTAPVIPIGRGRSSNSR